MRAINNGEGVSEVINQETPTVCIQVPILDTTVAIQIERKSAWRSGLHAEVSGLVAVIFTDDRRCDAAHMVLPGM